MTHKPEERREVTDEPRESLVDGSVDTESEHEWSKEVQQRMSDVADDRVALVDADDVHRELRSQLRDIER